MTQLENFLFPHRIIKAANIVGLHCQGILFLGGNELFAHGRLSLSRIDYQEYTRIPLLLTHEHRASARLSTQKICLSKPLTVDFLIPRNQEKITRRVNLL